MSPTDADLLAYLDELLPIAVAAQIEQLLRDSPELRTRAGQLIADRDRGGRSVGEVWRRHRLSCPSRSELASHVLEVLEPDLSDYVRFHVEIVGCRMCLANLEELQSLQTQMSAGDSQARRQRYFESSAGLLRSRTEERQ